MGRYPITPITFLPPLSPPFLFSKKLEDVWRLRKYVKVARMGEVPRNGMKLVKVDGLEVLLINAGGEFYAYDNRCPHEVWLRPHSLSLNL